MNDIVVDEPVCNACGAEVRSESQFCYNCGEAVSGNGEVLAEPVAKEADKKTGQAATETAQKESGTVVETNGGNDYVAATPPETGLRSAADIRKKTRAFERKPVRVVWEPIEESFNWVFVIVSLILLVLTLGVVALALYFK